VEIGLHAFPLEDFSADHQGCQRELKRGQPMKAQAKVGGDFADVAYKVVGGGSTLMPWNDVDAHAVAEGLPWRRFPWYLGQRNYSGMYWAATEAKLVGYESLLELSRLTLADYDRSSKRIVSQPFQITARVGGERLLRVPDYLVLTDAEPLVIDVTRRDRLEKPKYQHTFDLTRRVVELRGWRYELAHEPPRIEYANVRFLAGYRRPWLFDEQVLTEVRRFAESLPEPSVGEIVSGSRYPKRTALPALMHLLWRQDHLMVDITERLSPTTVVRVAS
jgi:hypothetical protein